MINKFRRVLSERRARLSQRNDIQTVLEEPQPSTNNDSPREDDAPQEERTIVEVTTDMEPKTEFEPVERHRHFGILHYTMNTRFRRMMIIGIINVIIIIAVFLFVFLFLDLHTYNNSIVVVYTTVEPPTTQSIGSCAWSYEKVENKCWQFNTVINDHIESERFCTNRNGNLVTIHSIQDHDLMQSYMDNLKAERVWIGMTCSGNDIRNCVWDDGVRMSKLSFNNFAVGHPNITKGVCVSYLPTDKKWYSSPCSDQVSFLCEIPMTIGSTSDCTKFYGEHCYTAQDSAPFLEAMKKCQALCGQLASVHSAMENEFIRSSFPSPLFFLGGYATSKGSVIWVDGSLQDYNEIQNFYREGCLFMSNNSSNTARGSWFTGNCSQSTRFICKMKLGVNCPAATVAPVTVAPRHTSTCNGVLSSYGTITSPNYPGSYPPLTNCSYTLVTYGAQRVNLRFHNVTIGTDQIRIYDGDSENGYSLGHLTGNQLGNFNSEGNIVYVRFNMGENGAKNIGFNASFTIVF